MSSKRRHFYFDINYKENTKMAKYIFVTGGVVSGLGKGLTAASLGRILKQRGLKVFMQKLIRTLMLIQERCLHTSMAKFLLLQMELKQI